MKYVPITELKARLSQYLDLVQSGEDVVVTDRGRPIARLAPLSGKGERASRLEQLIRLGRVRPPVEAGATRSTEATRRATSPRPTERQRPADPEGAALDALLDDRQSGP